MGKVQNLKTSVKVKILLVKYYSTTSESCSVKLSSSAGESAFKNTSERLKTFWLFGILSGNKQKFENKLLKDVDHQFQNQNIGGRARTVAIITTTKESASSKVMTTTLGDLRHKQVRQHHSDKLYSELHEHSWLCFWGWNVILSLKCCGIKSQVYPTHQSRVQIQNIFWSTDLL